MPTFTAMLLLNTGKGRSIEFDRLIAEAGKTADQFLKEHKESPGKRAKKGADDNATTIARASERHQPEENKHFLRQFGQSSRELSAMPNTSSF